MTIDNIIDNFLLSRDKFMPKIYLKQPRLQLAYLDLPIVLMDDLLKKILKVKGTVDSR